MALSFIFGIVFSFLFIKIHSGKFLSVFIGFKDRGFRYEHWEKSLYFNYILKTETTKFIKSKLILKFKK